MLPLIEKYKPEKLADLILEPKLRTMLAGFIKDKQIPNILLSGKPGIGKSTIARILIKEINAECLFINGSIDNKVEMVRDRIGQFADTVTDKTKLKVVFIDEADALTCSTVAASAQDALRNVIDKSIDDTRFVLTCNFPEKIIAPIKSRCTQLNINFTIEDVVRKVVDIIKTESIKTDKETFNQFINLVVKPSFPDIRNIINSLELISTTGSLVLTNSISSSELKKLVLQLIDKILDTSCSFQEIRKFYCDQASVFQGDFEILAGDLFDAISENDRFSGSDLITAAEHIYRIARVQINKEIQFAAMVLELIKVNYPRP